MTDKENMFSTGVKLNCHYALSFAIVFTLLFGYWNVECFSEVKKNEFTPEQLHEIVNNTPEGQRLLQEKKRRLEEEAGAVPREDSRVASLAEKVDEDLVVVEASSVDDEENT